MKTRLICWLIKVLLSLLIEETGGKSPERIDKKLKAIENDLQDAAQFAYTHGDKERGDRYARGIVTPWVIAFEVKQLTGGRVKLPKIKIVWPSGG